MHTFWARVNTVLTFAGSIAAVLCVLVSLTDLLHAGDPPVRVTLNEVKRLAPVRGGAHDQAALAVSLDADLRPAFSWNTKQLFVFLMAEYATPTHGVNQVVLWDRIVQSREEAAISLRQVRQKYAFLGRHADLRGVPLNLTLAWDVMPRVGRLAIRQRSVAVGSLPAEYVLSAEEQAQQAQQQQQAQAQQVDSSDGDDDDDDDDEGGDEE